MIDTADAPPLDPGQQIRLMRIAIALQCAGNLALALFNNKVLLTYLDALGFNQSAIFILLALPHVAVFTLILPLGYLSDHWGADASACSVLSAASSA